MRDHDASTAVQVATVGPGTEIRHVSHVSSQDKRLLSGTRIKNSNASPFTSQTHLVLASIFMGLPAPASRPGPSEELKERTGGPYV